MNELKPYVGECTVVANRIISALKGWILQIALMMPERAVKQLVAEVQKMHHAMKELNDNSQSRQAVE